MVRVGLTVLPFARIRRIIEHSTRFPWSPPDRPRHQTAQIVRAVDRAARWVPGWPRTCLVTALTAESMLRRHGHPATLRVGVAHEPGSPLEAHAWTECEGRIVVGREGVERFTPVTGPGERVLNPGEFSDPETAAQQLILAVAAPDRDPESVRRLLLSCEDWDAVFALGERHQILGQLAVVVGNLGIAADLPPAVAARLRGLSLESLLLDRVHAENLRGVIEGFDGAGIPFILLKGRGLAERLYDDPCERPSRDIDILVKRDSYAETRELLMSMGFVPLREDSYLELHFHVPFVKAGIRVPVIIEVHWDLLPPGSPLAFAIDDWWDNARVVRLEAGNVMLPPIEDEILYLAHHAFQMFAVTVKTLADVGRAIGSLDEKTWADVVARAEHDRTGAFLREATVLIRDFWGPTDRILPRPDPAAAGRRWLASNITAPSAILSLGRVRWWPFGQIGYWSLLPASRVGLAGLFTAVGSPKPGVVHADRRRSSRSSPRRLFAVGVALCLCCLPERWFPTAMRSS
jgi:hypothetical protein